MTPAYDMRLGDCLDPVTGMASLGDKSVDAVVTDPPYGVDLGNHGAANDGRKNHVLVKGSYDSYDDTPENFDAVVAPAVRMALEKAARALVFVAGHMAWRLPVPTAIGGIFLPAAVGRHAWGFNSFAHCLLYGQAPDMQKGCKQTGIRSTDIADKSLDHPCAKPLSWMLWAVRLASRPGDLILDPFAGSGTTGVAAIRLGRRFIGWEKDPKYHAIAMKRLAAAREQLELCA